MHMKHMHMCTVATAPVRAGDAIKEGTGPACYSYYLVYLESHNQPQLAHKPFKIPSRGWAIPHDVGTPFVTLAQDVEQEQVDIIVQRFVVQEELGQVAQILAVLLFLATIHLCQ